MKETLRYVAVPCRQDGKTLGVVRAAIRLTAIDQALSTIFVHIGIWSLLVAAMLAAVSLLHSRRIARPLEELQEGAERFARGDLAHRLPVADSLEIGALAETLNHMAAELDDKLRAVVRQRNEREAILSSMVEGVLALDADDRVIRINQAAARLINIDPARAEGRTLPELVRSSELYRLVDAVAASQQPSEGEIVLRGRDERILHVNGTVLSNARGGQPGVLLVLHDVTQLKKLEKVRRDFVANASHELRTPVTAIKGFVETLLDGAMNDPAELKRFLEIVDQQTDRLNALFEDLLTLSRIEQEAERAEIAVSPSPVRPVLEAAVEACRFKAAEKDIRIGAQLPRRPSGGHQSAAVGTGRHQPHRQRRQVQSGRADDPGRRRPRRDRGGDPRPGPRLRHRPRALAANLRAAFTGWTPPAVASSAARVWGWRL